MLVEFAVHVSIRKGLGPDFLQKTFHVAYDDVEESEVSDHELKEWAKNDVNEQLSRTEDYPLYGKNWIIEEVERI